MHNGYICIYSCIFDCLSIRQANSIRRFDSFNSMAEFVALWHGGEALQSRGSFAFFLWNWIESSIVELNWIVGWKIIRT